MKVLVVVPRWVGDAVLSHSLLKQIRKKHPTAEIDVMASPLSADLFSFMPEVSECLEISIPKGKANLLQRVRIAKAIQKRNYDWAIVMTGSFKSAIVPWLARIPRRTGTTHEFRLGLINDSKVADISKYPLSIDRAGLLALDKDEHMDPGFADWPRFACSADDAAVTLERFAVKSGTQKIVVLVPGSEGGEAKRWPADHYAKAAAMLHNQGFQVVIVGSEREQQIAQTIQSVTEGKCLNLCGKTTLKEAVHVLSAADCVICNDSGLLHVASALGKPVVAIYGPTGHDHTPPLTDKARIVSLALPCSPCYERNCPLGHHDCMMNITPARIVCEVQVLLSDSE